ncbi:hypothetical protein [Streptomyces sp. NPDC088812]|uniref:hypothetical protein n=1 Tax=Streptomyces sp. NPDC088812 TaxID=3365905 RepID=UPI00380677D7
MHESATATTASPTPPERQDPIDEFNVLTAGIHVEEWDTSTLDERLRNGFIGHYLECKDGTRILVFPLGQDSAQRLAVVRTLLSRAEATA